jgi:hypothetical protein
MEKLHELQEDFVQEGLKLDIVGLDSHQQMSNSSLAARKQLSLPLLHRLTFTIPEALEPTLVELLSHADLSDSVRSSWKSLQPTGANGDLCRIEVLIPKDKSQRLIESVRRTMPTLEGMTMLLETVGVLHSAVGSWTPSPEVASRAIMGIRDDFAKTKY